MTDSHGFRCACGESFDTSEELREHVDAEVKGVFNSILEDNELWSVANVSLSRADRTVRYVDLEKSDDGLTGLKVGSDAVDAFREAGFRPTAWYPDVNEESDMRIWLEDIE